ncbi:MAG: histidinol dehydrogenase, partial [Gammaproteobacteria bacterium]|nr:histidinol dehydrogenase [Gammaproteobacteria bacterium]
LFAQAEHDELSQSILLTLSAAVAERVQNSIRTLLPEMERREIIAQSLADNGAIIVADNEQELVQIADKIAPEHLQISTAGAERLAEKISHAGAIFVGSYSAESMGDYCAGPNHVLPTSGTARFSSPLGVYDFQKRTSMIQVSVAGAQSMGKNASIIARGESLTAHARSAEFRIKTS